ncbi:MAG: ankyrin repeat domain-containing protein [Nitrosomonadales bacterium]|nr:ankyrin repeat domain-containing protein [Nitrosomonadales bacterium]
MNDNELKCWLLQAEFKVSKPLQTNINGTIANATTPLMHAARLGNIDVLNALLARGADPTLLNADSNGALWFACFANSEACAAALIDAGASLDSQNVNGATALIYCISAGKTALVRQLLDAGANTALKTLDDFTALELAANLECMRMLRAAVKVAENV